MAGSEVQLDKVLIVKLIPGVVFHRVAIEEEPFTIRGITTDRMNRMMLCQKIRIFATLYYPA